MFRLIIPPSRNEDSSLNDSRLPDNYSPHGLRPNLLSEKMADNAFGAQAGASEVIRDYFKPFVGNERAPVFEEKCDIRTVKPRCVPPPHQVRSNDDRLASIYSRKGNQRTTSSVVKDKAKRCSAARLKQLAQPVVRVNNDIKTNHLPVRGKMSKLPSIKPYTLPQKPLLPAYHPSSTYNRPAEIKPKVVERSSDFYLQATLMRANSIQTRCPMTQKWQPISPVPKSNQVLETDMRSNHTGYTVSSLSDIMSFPKLTRRRIKLKAPLCA